jgi:NADPH2:quinone reductase
MSTFRRQVRNLWTESQIKYSKIQYFPPFPRILAEKHRKRPLAQHSRGAAGALPRCSGAQHQTTAGGFPKTTHMKAIVFERCGTPAEVLQIRDLPLLQPGRNQVRVRMIASPINPSDLLYVRGNYGPAPSLPASPGFEGVGVIDAVGPGLFKTVRGLRAGRRVAVLNGNGGNWQESVIVPARQAVPIPDDIADDQAASFFVNPATVIAMVERVFGVRPGDWLLQTAAASALGKMVIRLGKHRGFRTINVVRRAEHADELRRLGADEVIVFSNPFDEGLHAERAEETSADWFESRFQEWTKNIRDSGVDSVTAIARGQGVPFALDAVGGETALGALYSLGQRGRLLVYGTLSGRPIPVDPRLLIAGQKRIEGFWLSEWVRAQGVWSMLKLFREICALIRAGVLITPVAASYNLDEIQTAVVEAEKPGRTGKILLKIGP